MNDVNSQIMLNASRVFPEAKKDHYSGQIKVGHSLYSYQLFEGKIDVYRLDGNFISTIPASRILEHLMDVTGGDLSSAKCPWCVVAAVGLQATCSLTEGGTHAFCAATCSCGVAAVSTTCILGFRRTSCTCLPCSVPPSPPAFFPINGSWFGPFVPITDWGDGPFVIPE